MMWHEYDASSMTDTAWETLFGKQPRTDRVLLTSPNELPQGCMQAHAVQVWETLDGAVHSLRFVDIGGNECAPRLFNWPFTIVPKQEAGG